MKYLITFILLLSIVNASEALQKLEGSYLNKAEQLQSDRDKDVNKRDAKLASDSRRLAQMYLKSLKKIEVSIVRKGDLGAALKVRAKIKEIEAILKGEATRSKISIKKEEPKAKRQNTSDSPLKRFKGTWKISNRFEIIIYEVKDNEVWHNYIKNGTRVYSKPQKVDYIIIDGILGMPHIHWDGSGRPMEAKHNWIDLKNNRAIHTNEKDLSGIESFRKLTKISKTSTSDKFENSRSDEQ